MWLLLAHPELPTCQDCQTWLYSVDTWQRVERAGQPQPRPPGTATPCYRCPKSDRTNPQPHPERDPTPRTLAALEVFLQVRAGAPMPADPLVQRYCGLIQWVYDLVDRQHAQALPAAVLGLWGAGAAGAIRRGASHGR